MKNILISSLFLTFVFSASAVSAESYLATCPIEAQSILKAIGTCSTINCTTYSNICAKCCAKKTVVPVQTIKTTVTPSVTQKPVSKPKIIATTTEEVYSGPQKDLRGWEPASSTLMNATSEVLPPVSENKPQVGFVRFVKNIFNGFFKFFGFGK